MDTVIFRKPITQEQREIIRLQNIIFLQEEKLNEHRKELLTINEEFSSLKKHYEDLYNSNTTPIITIDKFYYIRAVNIQAAALLKQQHCFFINKLVFDFITINSKITFERKIQTLLEKNIKQVCEIELLQRGGNRKYVSMECVKKDELILIKITDITYLRQLETQLIQANNNYQSLLDLLPNISDAIAILDKDFYFKLMSKSFVNLVSKIFTTRVQTGSNFLTLISNFSQYSQQLHKSCHKAAMGNESIVLMENSGNEENYFYYELKFGTRNNAIILTIKDLTEYKIQKRIRTKLQAELVHAARVNTMGEMTSALAHDINQPLTAILLYAQHGLLLLDKKSEVSEIKQLLLSTLNQIHSQASHAGEIINRTKNFLRKDLHYFSDVDLNLLIKETLSFLQFEIKQSKIKINLNLKPYLPKINIDKIQIMQVILNLGRNSIEALQSPMQQTPEITIETTSNEGFIIVHFRDNGPGIPNEHFDQILNSYFTTKKQGTGLGLAICRTLIEGHGGKLAINPSSEKGAWFTFTLPIQSLA